MPPVKAGPPLQNFDDDVLNILRKLFLYKKPNELSVVTPFVDDYNKRFGEMVGSTVYAILNGNMNPRPSFLRAALEYFPKDSDLHKMFDVADASGAAIAETLAILNAVSDMVGGAITRLKPDEKGA